MIYLDYQRKKKKMDDSRLIKREDVESMIEHAQIISDGEYCGYCCDDMIVSEIPDVNIFSIIEDYCRSRNLLVVDAAFFHYIYDNYYVTNSSSKEYKFDHYGDYKWLKAKLD